ncbi:MAG: IclR family transcriptional regulator [Alphaproteobacteria bacterium]|nr:IclR family transcriptional regulator [Alphaproteobacteria bacterium]
MKTVRKALSLLDLFSKSNPEFGLTALAQKAGLDKATTLRMLQAMKMHGFIEQDAKSRQYRLGAGLLRLARLREATVPVVDIIQPVLRRLAEKTGETAHAALLAGEALAAVAVANSSRSSRVNVEPGLQLPLHATASGIAFLAFAPPKVLDEALGRKFQRFTDMTATDPAEVRKLVEAAHINGVGTVDRGFEPDVVDIAAPLFDGLGHAQGALTVVTPISRMSLNVRHEHSALLIQAALDCARRMGTNPPVHFWSLNSEAFG